MSKHVVKLGRPYNNMGFDGRIKLILLSEGVGWINLAQNRDTWRDAVNAVMNLRVQ
jgi:hypothetical protein